MEREIRSSTSETRRIDDTTQMCLFLLISSSAILTTIGAASDYPTNERTIVDFDSKIVVALPPNQREAQDAIAISDRRNGKGSKSVSPQKLHQKL